MAESLVRLGLGVCVRSAKMRVLSVIVVTEASELLLGFVLVRLSSSVPSQETIHVEFVVLCFVRLDNMRLLHYEARERG